MTTVSRANALAFMLFSILAVSHLSSQGHYHQLQPHSFWSCQASPGCPQPPPLPKCKYILTFGTGPHELQRAYISSSLSKSHLRFKGSSNLALCNVFSHSTSRFPFFEFVFPFYLVPLFFLCGSALRLHSPIKASDSFLIVS